MPEGSSTSLAQILGAEIMRVGVWNGHKFTVSDLEDIVAASSEVGYVPPVKVGHDESVGARAWGWVRNLRLAGEKLLGDLMDIPESLAAIIRERGYDQLSSEVYLDLNRNGKKFRRALKAVALLGAEVPAVSDLKPLRELFADYRASAVCFTDPQRDVEVVQGPDRYKFTIHDEGGLEMPETDTKVKDFTHTPPDEVAKLRDEAAAMKAKADAQAAELAEQKAATEAQAQELATLKGQAEALATLQQRADNLTAELAKQKEETLALQAKNREIALTAKLDAWRGPRVFRPYLDVLYRAAWESERTVRLSLEPGKPEEMTLEAVVDKIAGMLAGDVSWMLKQLSIVGGTQHYEDPGAEVHERAKKLMAADSKLDYKQAQDRVLDADEGLKKSYAGV
jgi:hypothetical protein